MFTVTQTAKRRPLTLRHLTTSASRRAVLSTVLGAVVSLLLLFGSLPATFADPPAIYSFPRPPYSSYGPDGYHPAGALVQGRDGNFYGTTLDGGSQDQGTIFKITPTGVLTTLFSFNGTNGTSPYSLTLGRDGNFYGTTIFGGNGTVFRVRTNGTAAGTTVKTLVNFNGTNGALPFSRLVQAHDGNFYGTTVYGGSNDSGTIFKITTDGSPAGTTLTTLVSLVGPDEQHPYAGLIQGRDGNFYGTLEDGADGYGAVFKLTTDGTPAGSTVTRLLDFNSSNGANPYAPLIQGLDGSFYGTTYNGGSADFGTIFKLTTDGTAAGTALTTLVTFDFSNGANPYAPLIQGNDGSFYGTTYKGGNGYSGIGNPGAGTAFKLTTDGTTAGTTLRTLVNFEYSNGAYPYAALVQGSDGKFYGATLNGGNSDGYGTIFKLSASSFAIQSLTFLPATVTGGGTTTGVVALKYVAVAATVVTLTSSNPAVLSVRSSVTVTLSHRHAVFTITTHPVTTPTDVTITATSYGVTKTSIVHVTP